MPLALHSVAGAIPGFLRFGRLQLPVFGVIATAGLLAALLLSQRTAPWASIDPNRLWDAGVLAVVSSFLVSRLLLVTVNLRVFLAQPLLVLAQPSLTGGGLVLTSLIVWFWLRRHGLPLARALDAWAAPAALLAAVLQLGHFVEGTDAGMPTSLPWALHTPGDLTFARVHPVQLYLATGYTVLCGWLYRRLRKAKPTGSTVSLGLVLGGALCFLAGFLRQPYDTLGTAWLDPSQYGALLAAVLGLCLWRSHPPAPAAPANVSGPRLQPRAIV